MATEVVAGVRAWFSDLQTAAARLASVAQHLPKLVVVKDQELPGIGGVSFSATHTST
ncbi:MAG TPA: hypothetical protein VIF11_14760 [Methylomirabilota bacterium]